MANFSISARTLFHLGAELITSDEIAIYELIKNSFDAGSPRVSIKFVVPISTLEIDKYHENIDDIQGDFKSQILKISQDLKKLIRNDVSPEVRDFTENTLLKLANCSNKTNAKSLLENINFIEVEDSGEGMSDKKLETAFLRIGTESKLEIRSSGKKKSRPILGNKGIGRLSMMRLGSTAKITTWSKDQKKQHIVNFDWRDFDAPDKSLLEIDFEVESSIKNRQGSGTLIKISSLKSDWDQKKINDTLIDKFIRRLQNPFDNSNGKFPIDISYNGQRRIPIKPLDPKLTKHVDRILTLTFSPSNNLKNSDGILNSEIRLSSDEKAIDSQTRTVNDICTKLHTSLPELLKIGPLKLSVHWYNRKKLAKKGLGQDLGPLRNELDIWNGGIAIYRDGFRVGLTGSDGDGDWLEIDRNALRGSGFTVNRIQTIGVLEVSKDSNPGLIDKSNREGFIDSREAELLKKILVQFGLMYLKEKIQSENALEKKELEREILEEGTDAIEDRLKLATKNLANIRREAPPKLNKEVKALSDNIQFVTNHVDKFSKAFSSLKETREDILELAGVGTVVTSVLHELERTTKQTKVLLSDVAKKSDPQTKELLNKLEDEIKSINVRLSQLDPLTPSGRQRKSSFNITALTKTILEGYKSRFERHDIEFSLTVDGEEKLDEVKVKMVKGFYSLAIENLLTNSIYWLKEGPISVGHDHASIHIDIESDTNSVVFSDTGPGISAGDKDRIFNPGFSLRHRGNGFGLYIAKEVANHHDANIYLDTETSEDGRHRTFILELPRD